MDKQYFAQLYTFTAWANRRVWGCILQLDDAAFRQELDYSIGSIFTQTVHTMGVEYWWLNYLRTGVAKFLNPDDFPDRASIRTRWDEIEAINHAYINTLTPEELAREVRPAWWEENERAISVREALTQVAFHSMDHRAQTLAMLHKLAAPTVEHDFLLFMQETHIKGSQRS
jgi:uncharacterized damage-inducible protein DinB